MKYLKIIFSLTFILMFMSAYAHIDPNKFNAKPVKDSGKRLPCRQGEAQEDMQINNVRARLLTGGDVWWNLDEGQYVVPRTANPADEVSALFAGGVWIGGVDKGNNIKLAGVTYRNATSNYDWFPGPLDKEGLTELEQCNDWDQFFTVGGADVLRHIEAYDQLEEGQELSIDSIPQNVLTWPGQGNPFFEDRYDFKLPDQPLGSFWDEDGDTQYNPTQGDFPIIDIRKCEPLNREEAKELVADEMKFWIYNDNGNTQQLSRGGQPIQMEVQVQAFAYATNDEINDMTFYRYKLLNKASSDIFNCYFAMWVDPDLGCAFDDYIGVDTVRSMAYVYNSDAIDGDNGENCSSGQNTYGSNVPLLGIDYFRGPRGAKIFLRNALTGEIVYDTSGAPILVDPPQDPPTPADTLVEIGMSSFIYMENCSSGNPEPNTCDPEGNDRNFYRYLRGLWLDGTPITYGGTGYNPSSTDTVSYVLTSDPNSTDPDAWSMCTANLSIEGDRRTLQATGPLVLQPGATNELIIGVPFVPSEQTYPCPDISRLQAADDIAQALFDSCFDILDGPDAPDVTGVELDRELVLVLTNDIASSNNKNLSYSEKDIYGELEFDEGDALFYKFEGYKVFQLANADVTPQELDDVTKARLIRQVDLENEVATLYNWVSTQDPTGETGELVWSFENQDVGANQGLFNSFSVKEDQFAETDKRLVNHRDYHFMVLAYAHNEYLPFDFRTGRGQRTPYLEGRRNVKVYSLTPRPIVYEELQSEYGEQASITRITGRGNGGMFLDLAEGMHDRILQDSDDLYDDEGNILVEYMPGAGPFSVKVYNPLEVENGKYRLELIGEMDDDRDICALEGNTTWLLTDVNSGETVASDRTIEGLNEQLILKRGFSVAIQQVRNPGDTLEVMSGAISMTADYDDPLGNQWLTALGDDQFGQLFIGFGANNAVIADFDPIKDDFIDDPNKDLSQLGPLYPFMGADFGLSSGAPGVAPNGLPLYKVTPGITESNVLGFIVNGNTKYTNITRLNNIDVVMTSDRDKWSRCIVVETASPHYYGTSGAGLTTINGEKQFEVRQSASVDKFGNEDNTGTTGYGWFPGYAVDVETGQRLNIFFGENSVFRGITADSLETEGDIGSDMIWNPSSQLLATNMSRTSFNPAAMVIGGQHFVYVTNTEYDSCQVYHERFETISNTKLSTIGPAVGSITWCTMPMLTADAEMLSYEDGLIPNDITIKVRVSSPFGKENIIDPNEKNTITKCVTYDELPSYEFEFGDVASRQLESSEYATALDNVRIVPNPYYAYSAYESDPFVQRIKVTNLPERAIITIFTIDGKFIRRFDREERPGMIGGSNPPNNFGQINPSVEWDLKNDKGIPVASGVYLFHIEAPELNEEIVLKWFGVNRQFDPSTL